MTNRQPKGVPVGGQFAAGTRDEADLPAPSPDEEVFWGSMSRPKSGPVVDPDEFGIDWTNFSPIPPIAPDETFRETFRREVAESDRMIAEHGAEEARRIVRSRIEKLEKKISKRFGFDVSAIDGPPPMVSYSYGSLYAHDGNDRMIQSRRYKVDLRFGKELREELQTWRNIERLEKIRAGEAAPWIIRDPTDAVLHQIKWIQRFHLDADDADEGVQEEPLGEAPRRRIEKAIEHLRWSAGYPGQRVAPVRGKDGRWTPAGDIPPGSAPFGSTPPLGNYDDLGFPVPWGWRKDDEDSLWAPAWDDEFNAEVRAEEKAIEESGGSAFFEHSPVENVLRRDRAYGYLPF